MRFLDPRQSRLLTITLAGTAVAAVLVAASQIAALAGPFTPEILIGFFALLLAFSLDPLVRLAERFLHLPRPYAAALVYLTLAIGIIAIAALLIGSLVSASGDLMTDLPSLRGRLPDLLERPESALQRLGLQIDLVSLASSGLDWVTVNTSALATDLRDAAFSGLGAIVSAGLVLSLSAFISADGPALRSASLGLLPAGRRPLAERALAHFAHSFGGFLRGQGILGLIYGLAVMGLSIWAGLPWAPLLAAVSGLAMAIPFFGPILALFPVLGAAILVDAPNLPMVVGLLLVFTLLLLNLVQPRLLAGTVGLRPVLVLAAVLIGGRMAGPIGAVFALPLFAGLVALLADLRDERYRTRMSDQIARAAPVLQTVETVPVTPSEPGASEAPDQGGRRRGPDRRKAPSGSPAERAE